MILFRKNKSKKYYVVWKGRQTGVFETWSEFTAQIDGFPDAVLKFNLTRQLAEEAYKSESDKFLGKDIFESELSEEQINLLGEPILE